LSIRHEIPFSVKIFAAIPPEWPDPIIKTSTVSSTMVPQNLADSQLRKYPSKAKGTP
jgi:hypothetical protein